jgi:hypothetical protein
MVAAGVALLAASDPDVPGAALAVTPSADPDVPGAEPR